jgi:hypothetical protein
VVFEKYTIFTKGILLENGKIKQAAIARNSVFTFGKVKFFACVLQNKQCLSTYGSIAL